MLSSVTRSDYKILFFFCGFFSVANGFFFQVGSFNLRLYDLFFLLLPVYWFFIKEQQKLHFSRKIYIGFSLIFCVFLYFTFSGFFRYGWFNEVYQDFFVKYYINKILWIIIYAIIYMMYGNNLLFYFLCGLSTCIILNSLFVFYEYAVIANGYIPDYSFLESFGLYVESKKNDVINQNMIRPTGLMLDPNYTGGYSGIALIFLDYLRTKSQKWLFYIFQFLCVIIVLLVFSRTGLFSLLLCFFLSLILYSIYKKKYTQVHILSLAVFFLGGLLVVFYLMYLYTIDESVFEMLVDRLLMNDSSAGTRTLYLETYCNEVDIVNLLFGCGTGASGMILGNIYGGAGSNEVWSPESNIITFFIEQGLVFICFYFFLTLRISVLLFKKHFYYFLIFMYVNLIGISYNFLGDRIFFFLYVVFCMFSFANREGYKKNIS